MKLTVFNEKDEVFLLGEGNFSYALSLFRKNLNIEITASCYETEVKEGAKRNVEILKENGLRVLFGIDATKLKKYSDLENQLFDKVIFNFPHVGGKMRIEKNRDLLKNFFISVVDFLKPNGQVLVTLCNGQGGTPVDNPRRNWKDSWQIVEMAAHGNFILTEVEPFQFSFFENYLVTGYRSLEKQFNVEGSLTHFFKLINNPGNMETLHRMTNYFRTFNGNYKSLNNFEKKENTSDPVSLYPLSFSFDITFLVKSDFSDSKCYEVLYKFAGPIISDIKFIDSYEFPNSDKKTRTYRISYMSYYIPLYRKRVIDIHHNIITKILEENLEMIVLR